MSATNSRLLLSSTACLAGRNANRMSLKILQGGETDMGHPDPLYDR